MKRYLIVNADDFGQSPGVNRGVIQAYEQGILTSASLMVRWPAAREAAEYARANASLGVGLHIDLGEWTYRAGQWEPMYQVVDESDVEAVEREVRSQLDVFTQLLGRTPTHVDSHQHRHMRPPLNALLPSILEGTSIPIRGVSVPYCGAFYGQDNDGASHPDWISPERLIEIIAAIGPGFTELACHPAAVPDLETMYRSERVQELASLCNPLVRRAIDTFGIGLCSFSRDGNKKESPVRQRD